MFVINMPIPLRPLSPNAIQPVYGRKVVRACQKGYENLIRRLTNHKIGYALGGQLLAGKAS